MDTFEFYYEGHDQPFPFPGLVPVTELWEDDEPEILYERDAVEVLVH